MLSRRQRAAHEVDAHVRVSGDVENPYARILQQGLKIAGDAGAREIGVASRLGALNVARADRNDVQPIARVGVKMRAADPARADERDRHASVARHRRTIGQVRRFRFRHGLRDQRVVVRGRFAGLPAAALTAAAPACALAGGERRGVDDALSGAAKAG